MRSFFFFLLADQLPAPQLDDERAVARSRCRIQPPDLTAHCQHEQCRQQDTERRLLGRHLRRQLQRADGDRHLHLLHDAVTGRR